MTEPHSHRWGHECQVVVGADAVREMRCDSPVTPIVALVDDGSPVESLLAQAAGADVVLTVPERHLDHERVAGLDLAVQATRVIAHRRQDLAASSRRVGHDLAQALNVIALAAEAGSRGYIDTPSALDRIGQLARQAGADAWRAGRPARSAARVMAAVPIRPLLRGVAAPDVDVQPPPQDSHVLADERGLAEAIAQLVDNSRRAAASRIAVEARLSSAGRQLEVVVSDDGHGFSQEAEAGFGQPFNTVPSSNRPGLGLAVVTEYAADFGGSLTLADNGRAEQRTQVVLSLATVEGRWPSTSAGAAGIDQAATQADILQGVVRHAPLDESLEAIVAAIESELPGVIGSILLIESDRRLHHRAGARLPVAYRQAIDGVAIGPGQGSCGTAAHLGRPVVASDVTVDHNWTDFRQIAAEHRLRACWSTPIVASVDGDVLGTFAVYKPTVWEPDRAAIRLVNRYTYLATVAIEHHRLSGALAESEARTQLADLRARQAAEAANRAKTDFIALASHELRTPLNAILGFAQVMQFVDLDERQRAESVAQIVQAGRHLRDLIDEFLDLSRIESGQLAAAAKPVDTSDVVAEAIELVRPLASSRSIELANHAGPDATPWVLADRRCMRQVLINLLDNAVKYSPVDGRVDVGVSCTPDGSIRISVTDAGPGISEDSLAVVFEPFHRLDRDADEQREGTGLGLALCARLMREMGGSIGVASTVGAGSCFWTDFPASAPPARPAGRSPASGRDLPEAVHAVDE